MTISLTAFRQNLYQHVRAVLADETGSLRITTKDGEVELVNSTELSSLREFHHLFSSLANAKRLIQSIERSHNGLRAEVSLAQLKALVGDEPDEAGV